MRVGQRVVHRHALAMAFAAPVKMAGEVDEGMCHGLGP